MPVYLFSNIPLLFHHNIRDKVCGTPKYALLEISFVSYMHYQYAQNCGDF